MAEPSPTTEQMMEEARAILDKALDAYPKEHRQLLLRVIHELSREMIVADAIVVAAKLRSSQK